MAIQGSLPSGEYDADLHFVTLSILFHKWIMFMLNPLWLCNEDKFSVTLIKDKTKVDHDEQYTRITKRVMSLILVM